MHDKRANERLFFLWLFGHAIFRFGLQNTIEMSVASLVFFFFKSCFYFL